MKKRLLAMMLSAIVMITAIPAEPIEAAVIGAEISDFSEEVEEVDKNTEIDYDDEKPAILPTEMPEEEMPTASPTESVEMEEPTFEPTEVPDEKLPEESPSEPLPDSPEATPSAIPTTTPGKELPTVSPTAVPDKEVPVISPSELPGAAPEESQQPGKTPSSSPTATPIAAGIKALDDKGSKTFDTNEKVVGTNNVHYENVAYLSARTVNSLPEDMQDVYVEMCDTIAEWYENGQNVQDIVISVDENQELELSVTMWQVNLYTEDEEESSSDNKSETDADRVDDKAENDTNKTGDEMENNTGEADDSEEDDKNKSDSTEVDINEADDAEIKENEEHDRDSELEIDEEETVNLESAEAEDSTENVVISENVELAAAYAFEEESFDTASAVVFNTLHTNENYFRNQLDATEQKLYDAGKASMINKGGNSFS